MSKSEGSSVSLDEAIERHGAEPLRWFLMREVGFSADGDFTFERLDARYTSDLADGLGNLASRVTAMLVKYRDGKVPEGGGDTPHDKAAGKLVVDYSEAMDALELRNAAAIFERLVAEADGYVSASAPWSLAKAGGRRRTGHRVVGLGQNSGSTLGDGSAVYAREVSAAIPGTGPDRRGFD